MTKIKIKTIDCGVKPKDFYVYTHIYASGPKEGKAFYVGKGKGNRYKSTRDRSEYWKRLSSKYGVYCKIINSGMNERCAFTLEKILIKSIGRENLCNLTDGGDGVTGIFGEIHHAYNHEINEYWHDFHGYRKCTQWELRNEFNLDHSKLSNVTKGNRLSVKGWVLIENKDKPIGVSAHSGKLHTCYQPEIYKFIHKDGRLFEGSKYDFRIMSGCHSSNIHNLVSGKYKFVNGWMIDRGNTVDDIKKTFKVRKIKIRITNGHRSFQGGITYVCERAGLNRSSVDTIIRRGSRKYKDWIIEVLS